MSAKGTLLAVGEQPLSLNEWVCLALLAEQPSHGFAVAKQLTPDSDLGRILTIRRPLVYRAIDRLVSVGHVEPLATEPGESGPTRTIHRATTSGRRAVGRWLESPVGHVRDLRVEFLAKLRLLERRQLSPQRLIDAQHDALGDTLDGLIKRPGNDVVDLWRASNAQAVNDFFDRLRNRPD